MTPLAYLDPGPGSSVLQLILIPVLVIIALALIFGLVKFVKWAWGAGERE